jgi:hypothetical protein
MKFLFNILAVSIVYGSSTNILNERRKLLVVLAQQNPAQVCRGILIADDDECQDKLTKNTCVTENGNCKVMTVTENIFAFTECDTHSDLVVRAALDRQNEFRKKIEDESGTFVIENLSQAEQGAIMKKFSDFYAANAILNATGNPTQDGNFSCLPNGEDIELNNPLQIGGFWLQSLEKGTPITYGGDLCKKVDDGRVIVTGTFSTAANTVTGNITNKIWVPKTEFDEFGDDKIVFKIERDEFDCQFWPDRAEALAGR